MLTGAEVLIENNKGEVLVLLRDDKPTIRYPNHWDFLGGGVEEGEAPEQAVRRELKEELELELPNLKFLKAYHWPDQTEYIFHAKMELDVSKTNLHEGQMIKFFPKKQLMKMKLGFHDNEILRDLFSELRG